MGCKLYLKWLFPRKNHCIEAIVSLDTRSGASIVACLHHLPRNNKNVNFYSNIYFFVIKKSPFSIQKNESSMCSATLQYILIGIIFAIMSIAG
jgi:hypothetical protein